MRARRILRPGLAILAVLLAVFFIAYLCAGARLYSALGNLGRSAQRARTYTCETSTRLLEVSVDPGGVSPGEAVTVRFKITNTSTETLIRDKNDGPVIDLVIPAGYYDQNPQGGALPPPTVRWSETQPSDQVPHHLELKPGESRTIQLSYTPKVRQGWEGVKGLVWGGYQTYDECSGTINVGATFQ